MANTTTATASTPARNSPISYSRIGCNGVRVAAAPRWQPRQHDLPRRTPRVIAHPVRRSRHGAPVPHRRPSIRRGARRQQGPWCAGGHPQSSGRSVGRCAAVRRQLDGRGQSGTGADQMFLLTSGTQNHAAGRSGGRSRGFCWRRSRGEVVVTGSRPWRQRSDHPLAPRRRAGVAGIRSFLDDAAAVRLHEQHP